MSDRKRIEELAKHVQGKASQVKDGRLKGSSVEESIRGGVRHQGDRVNVVNGMIFMNGTYYGSAPRR